jgi:hypothetical protein
MKAFRVLGVHERLHEEHPGFDGRVRIESKTILRKDQAPQLGDRFLMLPTGERRPSRGQDPLCTLFGRRGRPKRCRGRAWRPRLGILDVPILSTMRNRSSGWQALHSISACVTNHPVQLLEHGLHLAIDTPSLGLASTRRGVLGLAQLFGDDCGGLAAGDPILDGFAFRGLVELAAGFGGIVSGASSCRVPDSLSVFSTQPQASQAAVARLSGYP